MVRLEQYHPAGHMGSEPRSPDYSAEYYTLVLFWNKSINWGLNYLLLQVKRSGSQDLPTTAQLMQKKQARTGTEDLGLRSPGEGRKKIK